MGSDWKYLTLGSLITLQRGHDLPSQDRKEGAVPIMGSSGLTGFHNIAKCNGPGVVLGRSGNSMGVVSYCDRDYWPLNTTLYITDFKGNDPRYIYYLLSQIDFDQFNSGSAQKSLNRNFVYPFEVWATSNKREQKEIAELLETYEHKIELNRQMNSTLEALAQSLFKSWFVDFDPVIDNALAAGNPIPEALQAKAEARQALGDRRKPLPEEIRKQFPSRFVLTDEMGWVPEGWEVGQISLLCEKVQNGGTPKRDIAEYWEEGTIPWLTSGEVRQTIICSVDNQITELGLKNSSAKWLPKGTTVIAMYGATAGQVAFVSKPLTTNQAVCGLIPKESYIFFNYLALERVVVSLANQARGSAQQNISKGIIEETPTVIPPDAIGQIFSEEVGRYFDRWIHNLHSTEVLEKLRDTLLPKLLSGQLRIHDAERQLAEVC